MEHRKPSVCKDCATEFPYEEFTRFYTFRQAERLGYGKPFEGPHAEAVPVHERTRYFRMPKRVRYQCSYCRSCRPQKPFLNPADESEMRDAALAGVFGPYREEALRRFHDIIAARDQARAKERKARAPGSVLRRQIVKGSLLPIIEWQRQLSAQKLARLRHVDDDDPDAASLRAIRVHAREPYEKTWSWLNTFWMNSKVWVRDKTYVLPRKLVMDLIDPLHADERDGDPYLQELRDQPNGEKKYVLALFIKGMIEQEHFLVSNLQQASDAFARLETESAVVVKKPLALGIYDFVQEYLQGEEAAPNNPGEFREDMDNPRAMIEWMYAKARWDAYIKRRQTGTRGRAKNAIRVREGLKPLGRPPKKAD